MNTEMEKKRQLSLILRYILVILELFNVCIENWCLTLDVVLCLQLRDEHGEVVMISTCSLSPTKIHIAVNL